MKRKAVVMLMTAVMAIAIAACGEESAGDSTPVDAAVEQSGGETLSTEDAGASGETESGNPADSQGSQTEDAEDSGETESGNPADSQGSPTEDAEDSRETESRNPADSQESRTEDGEKESSGAADGVDLPDNYDWASVDWEREIMKYSDSYYYDANSGEMKSSYIGFYAKDLVLGVRGGWDNYPYYYIDENYENLDEESITIFSKLQELSDEELSVIFSYVYPVPDNYDWASVDWWKPIGRSYYHAQLYVASLSSAAMHSVLRSKEVEDIIDDEYMYIDSLDEDSKAILDKLKELTTYDELYNLRVNILYNPLWPARPKYE